MALAGDPNRFHRVMGWVAAIGALLLICLPALIIITIGECLPRGTSGAITCDAQKRFWLIGMLIGSPLFAAAVGWLGYRYSKFLG